ncbi:Phosphorylated carbohydrates phosphatase TM_1254 [Rothia kristinae]|nr:Phosphorylated carbohydrates phosphatase TM_1254 [Rothia kristinae]
MEAEILTALTDLDMERLSRGVDLLPGALELVRALAAVMPVAVASNSRRDVLDLKMRSGGYAPLLSTWVSTDDVPAGKPAPDMYAEAVRRMGCAPGQAVAFEDSAPGATAAVRAGTGWSAWSRPTGAGIPSRRRASPRPHWSAPSWTPSSWGWCAGGRVPAPRGGISIGRRT